MYRSVEVEDVEPSSWCHPQQRANHCGRHRARLKSDTLRGVLEPMPAKKPVKPRQIDRRYVGMPVGKRMTIAVELVMSGAETQSEAARMLGVTRPRLNQRVKLAREKLVEQQARSEATAAERRGEAPSTAVVAAPVTVDLSSPVLDEVRRVPPFAEFDRMYFGGQICFDCGVTHATPPFHFEMMEAITDPSIKRLLINLAAGHSKSTIGSVKSTIYELCRDPNSMSIIISKTAPMAQKFLYQIKNYLTNPLVYSDTPSNLIEHWGPFAGGDAWSAKGFYVAGRQSVEKDPTVAAYGVGQHIQGARAHRIVLDDIADLENQGTAERVKGMMSWITQQPLSRVGQHGKLIFIGTRVGPQDIYSFLEILPGYKVIRYPCIIDEEAQITLWPDHFPYKAAVEMRDSMSAEEWQLLWQNVTTAGYGASFTPEMVESCYDSERSLGQYDPKWTLVGGLDPAGAGPQGGTTAFILLGLDLDTGAQHLVDLVAVKQMKAPQMRDQLFDWADRYPQLREFRVETNGLQGQLTQYNTEIMERMTARGIRVAPHVTTGRNKWDADFGVESMSTMFVNRMFSLPTKDLPSRNRIKPLVDQLVSFPMGHINDLLMAMWFAFLGCRDINQRAQLPMFDPRFKAPKRIMRGRRTVDFADRTVRSPGALIDAGGRPMFPTPDKKELVQLVNTSGSIWV